MNYRVAGDFQQGWRVMRNDVKVAYFRSLDDATEYARWKSLMGSCPPPLPLANVNPVDYIAGRHPSTEVEDDYIDSPVQDSSRPPAILPPAGWQNQPIPQQQQEPKPIKFREFL